MSDERGTMLDMRDSLLDALKRMPATGIQGQLHPAPVALARVLKWLRADETSQATFQAWYQAIADGNAALAEQLEADIRRVGFRDMPRDVLANDAEWQGWLAEWAGPAEDYAGKPSHVRAREAYHAWKAGR